MVNTCGRARSSLPLVCLGRGSGGLKRDVVWSGVWPGVEVSKCLVIDSVSPLDLITMSDIFTANGVAVERRAEYQTRYHWPCLKWDCGPVEYPQ